METVLESVIHAWALAKGRGAFWDGCNSRLVSCGEEGGGNKKKYLNTTGTIIPPACLEQAETEQ